MNMFRYLNYGLAAVLTFVGLKMIAEYWLPRWGFEFHFFSERPWASLVVILTLLGISIAASVFAQRRELAPAEGTPINESPTNEPPMDER